MLFSTFLKWLLQHWKKSQTETIMWPGGDYEY